MNAIIPEIVEDNFDTQTNNNNNDVSIKLKKVDNNQTYNNYTTNNYNNNINNNSIETKKSVIKQLFMVIFFPVILIYSIGKHVIMKFDYRENYKEFMRKQKVVMKRVNMTTKYKKAYFKDDEVF